MLTESSRYNFRRRILEVISRSYKLVDSRVDSCGFRRLLSYFVYKIAS